MGEEFLAFVTIDVWTMIFTWANLIILFLLMKKFLFKPINNILEKRKKEIDDIYDAANSAKSEADTLLAEYSEKVSIAQKEADDILALASSRAAKKEEEVLAEAANQAAKIVERANRQVELEKTKAKSELIDEVSSLSVLVASKILQRDISEKDHAEMIDKFINEIGEGDGK